MPTHTAASPIPAPGQVKRRRSGVLQSSLDLVFSYSRSQQILYGKKQGSAPSFLETSSHSWSPEYLARDEEAGGYADGGEEEEYERDGHIDGVDSEDGRDQRDMSDREGDTDWAGEGSDTRAGSNRRRSSGSPHLFPYDPIPAPTMPPAPPSAYSGHSRSSNAGSTEPTPRIGMLNLLPEYAGASAGRSAQSGATKRMFSGSSSTSASTVAPAANAKTSHPAQRVYEGVSPLDKGEPRDEAGAGVADERTPLVGQGQGQHVTYSSPPESHIHRVTSREIGTSRRRSSVVQRMGHAVERRESMVGGRRASAGRRKSEVYRGESTDGQTLFNAVAVLLGIGILSLPLAFAYAGWIGGTAMLLGFAWLTCHTAKLLARLIQADRNLMGYTDIGRAAFGRAGGIGINLLFCLELFALGVALIVLFGDTLEVLFPNTSSNTWKLLGLVIVLPTTLLPLHLLSLPSLLSTVSTFLLVLTVLLDGFIKTSSPGSIIHPAKTSIGPELAAGNWLGGIGLVLAGFGGHAVVPSLARDMRHPEHFDKVIGRAFAIAAGVSFIAGAAGYLMIGNDVSDEITRDLMQPKYGYPRWLNLFALWMIVIIPLTKFGLCSRPLNLTIEGLLGITSAQQPIALPADSAISDTLQSGHSNDAAPGAREHRLSKDQVEVPTVAHIPRYKYLRVISRTVVTCLCAGTAIILPGFGRVMAFLGSFSAFLICIILPLGFYLRLGPRLVRPEQDIGSRTGHLLIMVVGTGFMIAGTVWAFLPGSGHGDVVP